MAKKYIYRLNMNLSELSAAAETRTFNLRGDEGATAIMRVVSSASPTTYYNFKTGSFTSSFTSENNLFINLEGTSYYGSVHFPSGGASYTVLITQNPRSSDTFFKVNGSNKETKILTKKIDGIADSIVTFALSTDSNSSKYQTFPTSPTSTGNAAVTSGDSVDIDLTVENTESDAHGFGFRYVNPKVTGINKNDIFHSEPPSNIMYFQKTTDVVGDTSSSKYVVVDDISELAVGMEMKYKTGVTAPSSTISITAIDTDTNTLSLSVAESLGNGNTMTFRAYGSTNINAATGMNIDLGSNISFLAKRISKVVRADGSITEATDGSSTTIALSGTYGVGVNSTSTLYDGAGVNNSSSNAVTGVSASSSAGTITVQLAQGLKAGGLLQFYGTFATIDISADFTITKYPTTNQTIYIDLDKVLTPNAGS